MKKDGDCFSIDLGTTFDIDQRGVVFDVHPPRCAWPDCVQPDGPAKSTHECERGGDHEPTRYCHPFTPGLPGLIGEPNSCIACLDEEATGGKRNYTHSHPIRMFR